MTTLSTTTTTTTTTTAAAATTTTTTTTATTTATAAANTTTTTTTSSSSSSSNGLPGERSQYNDGPEIKIRWRGDFPCPYGPASRLNPPLAKWFRVFPRR